jgi:hypothetical protein
VFVLTVSSSPKSSPTIEKIVIKQSFCKGEPSSHAIFTNLLAYSRLGRTSWMSIDSMNCLNVTFRWRVRVWVGELTTSADPIEKIILCRGLRVCRTLAKGPRARNKRIFLLYSGRNEHEMNPAELPIECPKKYKFC